MNFQKNCIILKIFLDNSILICYNSASMKTLQIDRIRLKGLLSQKQRHLAKILGMHENTLSQKINGEAKFYLDELNQIAKFLNVDTLSLLDVVELQ